MQIGHIILFFGRAIAGIPVVLKNYRKEYTRLLSDVAWGNGSLVVGGGTAAVLR
jgi:phospholipid/cholesterol/gamma-HCH transport system permease protein